jgi:ADP-ribosyl-[dinitrogen reductase] hydrolase
MLIEIAIGDAYGAGFEYADMDVYRDHNTLAGYVRHRRHKNVPGTYTDDTQMSLAIAEAIVDDAPWTADELAERFVTAFKRDPRQGYAQAFYQFLVDVRDGTDFLARIRPDSDKSGAAMRAAPIGVFPAISEVLHRAKIQAALTHNTPDGIYAAQAAALSAHFFIYDVDRKQYLGEFLEGHVPGQWNAPWVGKVGPKGWMSVRAAVTAIMSCDRMSDLLKACIAFTGDVDTVAAIALGAASASSEIEQDLPPHLLESLEDSPFGRRYIEQLDARLLQKVRRRQAT